MTGKTPAKIETQRIVIDPTYRKSGYDVEIQRNACDVEWVAPGALAVRITFLSPFGFVTGKLKPGRRANTWVLPHTAHRDKWLRTPHGMPGVRLQYRVEVDYPSGTMVIDPYVIIQP